ncbi:MAG: hypothetical protein AAFR61_22240 [Bacteroidota bacterium]
MKYFLYALSSLLLLGCGYKSTSDEVARFSSQFSQDEFTLQGPYHWDFQLMGGTQNSLHTLYADSIAYTMKGAVYSTQYTMEKLSFDQVENKWIGRDGEGNVYVLFFKDQTDQSVSIYKHKCKNNGIEEALAFKLPDENATDDHGWNVYTYNQPDAQDLLEIVGTYANADHSLDLTDSLVLLAGSPFTKLSYHAGERRWVGKQNSFYLQLFFKEVSNDPEIFLFVQVYEDLEEAYQVKYQDVSFSPYTKIFP